MRIKCRCQQFQRLQRLSQVVAGSRQETGLCLIRQCRRLPGAGYLFLEQPALRDVGHQPVDARRLSRCVRVRDGNLLQPYLTPIGPPEAERHRMRTIIPVSGVQARIDRWTVIRMNSFHPFRTYQGLFGAKTEDFRGIRAQPYQSGAKVQIEGNHAAGAKRFLQPEFAVENRALVHPALAEQGSEDECAEGRGQNRRLGRQDALFNRKPRIAEEANGEYRRPDDGDRAHECRDRREGRSNPGSDPHKQGA